MIDVVRSWLHQCIHHHPQCSPLNSSTACSGPGSTRLPTRLIDLGQVPGCLEPRLVLPSTSEEIQYLTLSHAWSVTVNESHLKLSRNNIHDLQVNIPLERLSQTFRDAMAITQQLGYRYIWIDSLCIIQDSTEDWEKESATMCHVYGNSILTIAALGMNGLDGCFGKRDPRLITPCYLGKLQKGRGIYACPIVHNDRVRLMEFLMQQGARLPSRGWFLQERLLSPRTLYMGAPELYWECSSQTRCESVPEFNGAMAIFGHSWLFQEKVRFHGLCRLPLDTREDEVRVNNMKTDLLYDWAEIMRAYSASHLTYTKDRLVALSGITEAIQKGTNWTPVVGTWKELWPLDLLWFFHESDGSWRMPSGLKTPSWSWLTIEGTKSFPAIRTTSWSNFCLARVIDSTHHTGEVIEKETTITLKGYVRRAVWVDGLIKEEGPFHPGGSVHYSEETNTLPKIYWDSPPADGDAFLFLLIMSYKNRVLPDSSNTHYYGLILTLAHHGEKRGKTSCDHYRRVGMFQESFLKPQQNGKRGTRFEEGAQEEVVTIC